MRALITGITGFVGSHLAEYLLSQGVEVWGTCGARDMFTNIEGIKNRITVMRDVEKWYEIEMSVGFIKEAISEYKPDYIFYLADEKRIMGDFKSDLVASIIKGTANVIEAVRLLNIHPTIMLAGCGEAYGCPPMVIQGNRKYGFMPPEGSIPKRINHTPSKVLKLPVTEDFPLNPISIYGVSKAAQDMLAYAYHKEYGMKIVRTRAFDISGPRDESSVASDIARQIVEIERGKSTELKVGSREIKKDFIDVRDVVKAYWLAAIWGNPGEAYNICSGKARSIQTVIDTLRMQSTAQFEIVEDRTMMKVSDVPAIQGDYSKLSKLTGWKPEIGFAQTMGDLLDYWRGQV